MRGRPVYSEVEPFEGWKLPSEVEDIFLGKVYSEVEPFEGWKLEIAKCNHSKEPCVYSEVEPFEGWKLNRTYCFWFLEASL